MGNITECLKGQNSQYTSRARFSNVYPSISQDSQISITKTNDSHFYLISKQKEIDKIINYYKDVPGLNIEDVKIIDDTVRELDDIKSSLFNAFDNDANTANTYCNQTETSGSNVRLVMEIQTGKFFWPEDLDGLTSPYVTAKIVKGKQESLKLGNPKQEKTIEEFCTNSAVNALAPCWNQVFSCKFDSLLITEKLNLKVGLFYSNIKDKRSVPIGSEQTFYLSEVVDQHVRFKEVVFKSDKSLGLIAKVGMRVQLISCVNTLKQQLANMLEFRISQLEEIKFQHGKSFDESKALTNSVYDSFDKRPYLSTASNRSTIIENNYYIA